MAPPTPTPRWHLTFEDTLFAYATAAGPTARRASPWLLSLATTTTPTRRWYLLYDTFVLLEPYRRRPYTAAQAARLNTCSPVARSVAAPCPTHRETSLTLAALPAYHPLPSGPVRPLVRGCTNSAP